MSAQRVEIDARILMSGRAFSSRAGLNVIFPSKGNLEGNEWFTRGRGKVVEQVRAAVEQLLSDADTRPGWTRLYPAYVVSVRPDYVERGRYHWTAYSVPSSVEANA